MRPYADTSTDVTLVCGVQSGKTEWVVVDALAVISFGASYQLVQPKDDLVALFTRTRLLEPISRSHYYNAHVQSAQLNRLFRWKTESGEKGLLRVTFSNREDEMISFPADVAGVDEVDRCDLDNLALLPDRMMGSEYRLNRRSSTPTTVGNDGCKNIWWHYQQTDQMNYFLQCPHCGMFQNIDWLKNIVREVRDQKSGHFKDVVLRDSEWDQRCQRDIYVMCQYCDQPLDRTREGEWHPTRKVPARMWRRGYHMNKLLSPLLVIREMWADYVKAAHNPFEVQRFFNSVLGLPYVGSGTQITEEMLYNCVQNYILQPGADTCKGPCSAGIDVGPEFLDVRISSYPAKGIRRAEYIGKLRSFTDLHGLFERFNVKTAVVDAEPETREALRLQTTAKHTSVYVFHTKDKRGMVLADLLLERVRQERKCTIDRTLMMDCVLATYSSRQQILPKNIRFLSNESYVYEMTNPTRVLEVDDRGQERYVWTSGADHSFLADVYDYCAMLVGNFSGRPQGAVRERVAHGITVHPTDYDKLQSFFS